MINENFKEVNLGKLFEKLSDYTANGSFASLKENVTVSDEPNFAKWIMAKTLKKGNFSDGQRFTDKRGYEFLKKTSLYGGELLMPKTGNLGDAYIFPVLNEKATLADNVFLIEPTRDASKLFLYQYFKSSIFKKSLIKSSYGTSQITIVKKELRAIPISLPPLSEQHKIAEILSTIDDKIEVINQQIIETQALKKGLMQRLLTKGIGHTKFKDSPLGEIPEGWEVVQIGDVLKLGSGKDYKHLENGTIPVYGTGGIITYVDKYLFDGESVGIGRKGTIDKPVFLKGKFWTVDTLFYTHSFKNIRPFFVYIVFQSIKWRGYSEATGVPSLSKNIIEPIKILLPTIEEQIKISNIFSSIDEKLKVLSEKKTHYQELKQGLMQQLLTGKIRVKV